MNDRKVKSFGNKVHLTRVMLDKGRRKGKQDEKCGSEDGDDNRKCIYRRGISLGNEVRVTLVVVDNGRRKGEEG